VKSPRRQKTGEPERRALWKRGEVKIVRGSHERSEEKLRMVCQNSSEKNGQRMLDRPVKKTNDARGVADNFGTNGSE